MSTESEKKGIEASFKSMDTEEFLDIYFNRPIGYAWALFFKKLKSRLFFIQYDTNVFCTEYSILFFKKFIQQKLQPL